MEIKFISLREKDAQLIFSIIGGILAPGLICLWRFSLNLLAGDDFKRLILLISFPAFSALVAGTFIPHIWGVTISKQLTRFSLGCFTNFLAFIPSIAGALLFPISPQTFAWLFIAFWVFVLAMLGLARILRETK